MNFYENLVSGKYNTYEKIASADQESVKNALEELATSQLDVLAEELDAFTKEASEYALEDSLFEEEEYISYEIGKEAEETEEVETEEVEAEEVEETEEVETEEVETEEVETEEVEEEVEELESEASEEDEFEIIKEACEQVGEYLVDNDLTVADYVCSLTGLEKHASHIGEMAEKVAMVYDIPVVMAARDLVNTMALLVDEE